VRVEGGSDNLFVFSPSSRTIDENLKKSLGLYLEE
jgi:hypothetical protein